MKRNDDEKQFTFGTCVYASTSPEQGTLSNQTKILNIVVPFEESLKLNLAIDECIRKLNKYKRSMKQGKRAALNLSINLSDNRISINEGKLRK
jgi:hypothetical protein